MIHFNDPITRTILAQLGFESIISDDWDFQGYGLLLRKNMIGTWTVKHRTRAEFVHNIGTVKGIFETIKDHFYNAGVEDGKNIIRDSIKITLGIKLNN